MKMRNKYDDAHIRRDPLHKENEYNRIYFEIVKFLEKAEEKLSEKIARNRSIVDGFLRHQTRTIHQYERIFDYKSNTDSRGGFLEIPKEQYRTVQIDQGETWQELNKPDLTYLLAFHQTLKLTNPDFCVPILTGAAGYGAAASFFGYRALPIEFHSGQITKDRNNNLSNLNSLFGNEKILVIEDEIDVKNRKRTYEQVVEQIRRMYRGKDLSIEVYLGSIGAVPVAGPFNIGYRYFGKKHKGKSLSQLKKVLKPIFRIHRTGVFMFRDRYSVTTHNEPWRLRLVKELANLEDPFSVIKSFERDMRRDFPIPK